MDQLGEMGRNCFLQVIIIFLLGVIIFIWHQPPFNLFEKCPGHVLMDRPTSLGGCGAHGIANHARNTAAKPLLLNDYVYWIIFLEHWTWALRPIVP